MSFPRYSRYKDSGVEWIGQVPEHWDVVAGRRLFQQKREPGLPSDEQLSATQKYGVVPQKLFMEMQDQKVTLALSGIDNFKHVEAGDFVISLRSFQGGIERSEYSGCVSPAYTVLRPAAAVEGDLWRHLLKSKGYIEALQSKTEGIRDGKNISFEQFGEIRVPVIPPAEQIAIAEFLDRETGKIDELVAEQRRLMELLKEKRQAVISNAVTRGLNPAAPLKTSGNDWIGEIPKHWKISMPKHFTSKIVDGVHFKPNYVSEGVPFVTVRNLTAGLGISFDDLNYITKEDHEEFFKRANPEKGDVLITKDGATLGVARVVETDTVFSIFVSVALLKPNRDLVDPWFLSYALESTAVFQQFKAGEQGSALKHIHLVDLRNVWIALPPIAEQRAIVQTLNERIVQFETLFAEAQRAIDLLQERRTALISAAVTGQIDVRDLSPPTDSA